MSATTPRRDAIGRACPKAPPLFLQQHEQQQSEERGIASLTSITTGAEQFVGAPASLQRSSLAAPPCGPTTSGADSQFILPLSHASITATAPPIGARRDSGAGYSPVDASGPLSSLAVPPPLLDLLSSGIAAPPAGLPNLLSTPTAILNSYLTTRGCIPETGIPSQQPTHDTMFGAQQQQQTSNLFGGLNNYQPQNKPSLFGTSNNQQPQGGSLFGAPAQSSGLFGAAPQPQQSGGLFGATQQPQQPQQQGGGLFGGLGASTSTQPQQQNTGLFSGLGASTNNQQQGGLFAGLGSSTNAQPFGTSLLGASQQSLQQSRLGNLPTRESRTLVASVFQ